MTETDRFLHGVGTFIPVQIHQADLPVMVWPFLCMVVQTQALKLLSNLQNNQEPILFSFSL